MKRPTLVAAGSLNRLLEAAKAAWERKDFSEGIETLERARRLAPSNAGVLLQLGRFHGLRYNYAAAERCFESALRIAPKKIEMLAAIAEYCQNFRNPAVAELFLRRALERPDVTPLVCIKLAELDERLRRIPEATQLMERALAIDPAFPAALLLQARLERLGGEGEAGETVPRLFLNQPIPDLWIDRPGPWHQLGQNLDRQNRFDNAMAAFLQAKSLLQPQSSPYLDQLKGFRARLKAMEAGLSSEILQRWFAEGPALPPTRRVALLCGHARSGTTLLEQVLDAHPDIISADETTVSDDALTPLRSCAAPDAARLTVLEAAGIPALQQSRADYFRFIEPAIGSPVASRLLLETSPVLLYQIPAFIRILPETKFLIALRDPRDVVLSCFMQPQTLNPITAAYLAWREQFRIMPTT